MAGLKSGIGLKKGISVFTVAVMLAGALAVLPFCTQNVMGYSTPGTGVTWTFQDLVMVSGGAVTGAFPMFQVHETITVMPTDTLILMGGEMVMVDPGMGISIEILGMLDGNMGLGTNFVSGPGGSWQGIWVHGSGGCWLNGIHVNGAVNGIYIDHSSGFGMVQIVGCTVQSFTGIGIGLIGTMGGPMIEENTVTVGNIGFLLVNTSAQCRNNEASFCIYGFRAEGWAAPSIRENRIFNNSMAGVYLRGFKGGTVMGNYIAGNWYYGVWIGDSYAEIMGNHIWGINSTAGAGGAGIMLESWGGPTWPVGIQQNWVYGGRGWDNCDGGDAIVISANYTSAIPEGPQVLIYDNHEILGGDGGMNGADFGEAGDGGAAVRLMELPDQQNWQWGNYSVEITGNDLIAGGNGGMDNGMVMSASGNGGHGIYVADDNDLGSLLMADNNLIQGGMGGFYNSPMAYPGAGGDGIRIENCGFGAREDIRDCPDIAGGIPGMGPAGMGRGGCGINLMSTTSFYLERSAGRSFGTTFADISNCNGDFEIKDIRISDSGANGGNLVRATGSGSTGNNENWDFEGRDQLTGVILENCTMLNLSGCNITTSNATGMLIHNSGNISLDDLSFNITDGGGIVLNWTWNVDIFNLSMDIWWTDPFETDYGMYVEDSEDVNAGGLVMKWDQKDSPGGDYASAWKYNYYCGDSGNCTVSNSTLTGGKMKVESSANFEFVDSFFDVTYNTTGINNTGISIFNTTGAKILSSTARAYNGAAMELVNCNNTGFDCFETENECLPTGAFPSSPCRECQNTTMSSCRFIGENSNGLELLNCNGTFIVDSFFDMFTENVSANFTGLGIFSSNNTKVQNATVKTKNATGLKNMGANRTFVIDSFFDITFNVSGADGCGIVSADSIHLNLKNCTVKAANCTGVNITNDILDTLDNVHIEGSETEDPDGECDGIEGFEWDLSGIRNCTIKGFKGSGMNLTNSNNLSVFGNSIWNSTKTGIKLSGCADMKIYHNNIINNGIQASDDTGLNLWDDGYPSGGNYWSDYIGPDLMSGPLQNIPGPDGIGDVPYLDIQGGTGTVDQYPLMEPWEPEPESFFNISLNLGWNLVSIPLEMSDTSVSNVLSSIAGKYDSAMCFDPIDYMDPWKSLRPGFPSDLASADNTMGIWVHATEVCTLTVSGYVPVTTAIMLYAGWNLVGYPALMPMPALNALAGTNFDGLECWDAASPTLLRTMDPLEPMNPGCGYWVHVPADVIWTIDW